MLKFWTKMQLWQQVLIGLIAGIICGLVFGEKAGIIKPIGEVFINMIKMIVVPLIFFSLISGITSMHDSTKLGRVGVKAGIAFVSTTAFAITIGLVSANLLHPGTGFSLHAHMPDHVSASSEVKTVIDVLVGVVPHNAIGAMAEGNVLQVVFFAIFTGIALNSMGEKGERLIGFCKLMSNLVFKMIEMIIKLSPYGVFALISWVVGTQGMDVIESLAKLVMTVVIACFVQYLIFGLFIIFFAKISPFPFFRKSIEYQALAFSTSSSKATLATTMKVCRERLGISEGSTSFVLPLGASVNMDGTAIYLGICAVFFAQATGTVFDAHDYVMIILTSTLASIGAAGIPGGSLMMMSMVLSAVGLPLEGIAIIAGVDRILDMIRTTINITGDAAITLIVDKSEGNLDQDMYDSK